MATPGAKASIAAPITNSTAAHISAARRPRRSASSPPMREPTSAPSVTQLVTTATRNEESPNSFCMLESAPEMTP